MFGLALLAGLALWCILTLLAMIIGFKVFRYIKKSWLSGLLGVFTGFMLLMGGWFVYWYWEYHYLQKTVTKLCQEEGGLTVYVTPEEWRKQIGEEEWNNLPPEDWKDISPSLQFKFQGKVYYGSDQLNKRVISFVRMDERKDIIRDYDSIFVDKNTNQVLLRIHIFSVGTPAIATSLRGLKFWLDHINDCSIYELSDEDRFFYKNYSNSSISKGN